MRVTAITPMKNEGPFILEWVAYHRLVGVNDFLVFTNDCSDGTDLILERLDEMGLVRHMTNPSAVTGSTWHHQAAVTYAATFLRLKRSDWTVNMDVDEFIAVHVGDGTLGALFEEVPDAQIISLQQLSFGCAGIRGFEDELLISQFTKAFDWRNGTQERSGIKTLVRRDAPIRRSSNHAPYIRRKGGELPVWVNGGGEPIPHEIAVTGPKSFPKGVWSCEKAQFNHYAVRAMDTFLVQVDRGNSNFADRTVDLRYWKNYNVNDVEDLVAARRAPEVRAQMEEWLEDPELRQLHEASVAWYREKIATSMEDPSLSKLRERIERVHYRTWERPSERAAAETENVEPEIASAVS